MKPRTSGVDVPDLPFHADVPFKTFSIPHYLHHDPSQRGYFSQFFSTYRWQHDIVRSNHVTNPRDHNILLLGTICLFIKIEFYLFADWLQDLWGRLQFSFQYIRQRQHNVVRSIDMYIK